MLVFSDILVLTRQQGKILTSIESPFSLEHLMVQDLNCTDGTRGREGQGRGRRGGRGQVEGGGEGGAIKVEGGGEGRRGKVEGGGVDGHQNIDYCTH